jgi:hypothetical protein
MWVKPGSSQTEYADIIDNNHGGYSFVLQQDSSNINSYYWYVADGVYNSFIYVNLTANVWQHITMVYNANGTRHLYLNGDLVGSAPTAANGILYDGNEHLRLGRWGGGGRNWNGAIDEVRIYSTSLPQSQIVSEMNTPASTNNLVAYYRMDDNISDESLEGHNGSLVNAPVFEEFNANTYLWSTGATTPSIAVSTPGDYTVTVTNVNGCSATSALSTVTASTPTWYADYDSDGFGDIANTQTACTQPSGYVSNSTDCDDTNINIYQFATFYVDADADGYNNGTASVCSGVGVPTGYSSTNAGADCNDNASWWTNNCEVGGGSVVNLTLFIEGYYLGGNTMNSVRLNQDYVSPSDEVEGISVSLHDATTYALVDFAFGMLKTDGTLSVTFGAAPAGSYYIAVNGVNMIETWSADPQAIGTTPLSYDFSSSASQAYEDNMREIEPGVFAFYNGDINQDGAMDNSDFDQLFPDIDNSNFGVQATDLNGDGAVDNSDLDNIFGNVDNSIYAHRPY